MRFFKCLLIFLFFTPVFNILAQTTIEEKVERKFTFSPYLGVGIFPLELINEQGVSTNLFSGYRPAPIIGAMIWYKLKRRMFFGLDAGYLFTGRQINSLGILKGGGQIKVNLLPTRKLISPYIYGGLNIYFANIQQGKQYREFIPADTAITAEGTKTTKREIGYNELNLFMAPLVGMSVGGGFDIRISPKISVFIQAGVQQSVLASNILKSTFPDNQSPLSFASVQAGTNIRLMKKMKFEIDTQAVPVPDAIAVLFPPELEGETQHYLNREGNFSVNLREGLRHSLAVSVNNSELNIIMDDEGSPCKTKAMLYDQFGNIVAETFPDEKGKVNFSNLDKGEYQVVFEVQPPCQETNLSYKLTGTGNEILAQGNEEYTPRSDSLAYNIEGFIDLKSAAASKANIEVMLVNQDSKVVVARQTTPNNGAFSFKNLTPGNYKVIYEPPAQTPSRIAYNIKDNHQKLIKEENFPFKENEKKSNEPTRLMGGKLQLSDTTLMAYNVDVEFVDDFNRVVNHSIPNLDGSFEFIDKESEKKEVVVAIRDKKKEQTLLATKNAEPLVRSVSYEPVVAKTKAPEGITNNANKASVEKTAEPSSILNSEMEMYKLYNMEGILTEVEGFGFQVGAFRNLNNVMHLMEKLKAEGFNVYTQTVMSNDINTRFKSSQNYKLHRVIVLAGNNEKTANEIREKLVGEGYPIIVKERFKIADQTESQEKSVSKDPR